MTTLKSIATMWSRRTFTFALFFILWGTALIGLPFFSVFFGLVDLARQRYMFRGSNAMPLLRAYLFFLLYLSCEIGGLILGFGLWILAGFPMGKGSTRFIAMNAWLQGWWAHALLFGAIKIFSMKLEVEDSDCLTPGPIILLVRHSSTADTVLAAVLAAKNKGLLLRYVLKQELLWDPCLDVVGNRLPNVFINRSGRETAKELGKIKQLTVGLTRTDGVLLYPEGTRFHPDKLKRSVNRLETSGAAVLFEKASRMRYVLPPKPGGFLTVFQNLEAVDVVFCAHTGFEGASNFAKFFNGELIGQTIHVKFWRVPWNEVPRVMEKQVEWLYDQWLILDQWLAKRLTTDPKTL
jgi:1-acyl-sn-glycerol-3-phosphate acyltransferase